MLIFISEEIQDKLNQFRKRSRDRVKADHGSELNRALEDENRAAFELASMVSVLVGPMEGE